MFLQVSHKTRFASWHNPVGQADTAPVAATLTTALAGANNDLTFTAVTKGPLGNSNSITYVNPGTANATLSLTATVPAGDASLVARDFVVSLATNGSSTITTTANDILNLFRADATARWYVTVALAGGNDGTGAVIALAKTALASGTGMCEGPVMLIPDRTDTVSLQGKNGNLGVTAGGPTTQQLYVDFTYAPHHDLRINPAAAMWTRWTPGQVTLTAPVLSVFQEFQGPITAVRLVNGDTAGGADIQVAF